MSEKSFMLIEVEPRPTFIEAEEKPVELRSRIGDLENRLLRMLRERSASEVRDAELRRLHQRQFPGVGTPGSAPPKDDRVCLAIVLQDGYPVWGLASYEMQPEGRKEWENLDGGGVCEVLEYWPLPPSEEGWEQTWRRKGQPKPL